LSRTEEGSGTHKRAAESRPPTVETGTFAASGEYWTLGYRGSTFPLKDIKGLGCLQRLLRHPGEEFHALDLLGEPGTMSSAGDAERSSTLPEGTDNVGGLGDSGEMLDAQAKQAYKRRLHALNEELEDVRERGNHEREEQVESEIEFLQREIRRAVGLGGRDRRAGSAAERARLNVTRAIKSAIQKISEQHASMGALFERTIKTGSFCSYTPDPRMHVEWRFSRGSSESKAEVASELFFSSHETSFLRTFTAGTAFVARQAERAILSRCLEQALNGEGRIMLIGGAAGVGKTRIGAEISAEASRRGMQTFLGSCYDRDDPLPFVPFVEILEEALAQTRDLPAFREALGNDGPEIARLLPRLRRLFPEIPPPLELPPEQSRRILFGATSDFFARLARNTPVLLLFDDLHWADEGTLLLLTHLAQLVSDMPVLIVGTYRDFELDASGQLTRTLDELIRRHLAERITLGGLSKSGVAEMLRALSGRKPPDSVVDLFYSNTEGNPFFIEELFLHLVERGKLTDATGEFRQTLNIADIDVPRSLRLVIGRRLARVRGETQKILGAAAVIGRSFTFELLEASTGSDPDALLDRVEEAERAGLIYSTLDYPDARFQFSHELIRQAVVSELSAARRQRLHLDVANAIERRYPNTLEDHAEDLAHHLWQAGSTAEAGRTIRCLAMAANQAIMRSAGLEAIAYLSKGLDRLRSLPETPQRNEQELELQVRLGMTLTLAKGYSVPDVQRAYARARELCHQVGESPQLFRILRGLAAHYSVCADHKTAYELADQCLSLAQHLNDAVFLMGAHMELGAALFCMGDSTQARSHLERAIALHEPNGQRLHASVHGQDFGVSARARESHVMWFLGYPDQAIAISQEALALAKELCHPFTMAYAHIFAAVLYQLCANRQKTEEHAEATIRIADHHGFELWSVAGKFLRAWAMAEQGRTNGIVDMTEELASWRSLGGHGSQTHQPYFLALLAEVQGKAGQIHEGLRLLAEMHSAVERTGERSHEAEFYRLKGDLLWKSEIPASESVLAEAERSLHEAIAVARRQKAKSLELRAAMSVSQLWTSQGKRKQARELLSDVYGWFTEGFETGDLKRANAILAEMR
jgi:predicted ATPase